MGPTSAPAVLVLPDYGRSVRRVMLSPFKGLPESNTGCNSLSHALNVVVEAAVPHWMHFVEEEALGPKGL